MDRIGPHYSLHFSSAIPFPEVHNSSSSGDNHNSTTMLASAINRIKYRNPPSIQKVIEHLKNDVGINFLALDFDQTILDIHTGGNWKGSLEELLPHIRPVYAQLIRGALTNGMEVAVVTFTSQTKFVRGVLDHIFSSCLLDGSMDAESLEAIGVTTGRGNVVDTSHRIPIRGSDRTWRYAGAGSMEGKQPHMASAVEELEARREEDYLRAKAVARAARTRSSGGNVTPPPAGATDDDDEAVKTPPRTASNTTENDDSTPNPPEPVTRKTTLLLDDDSRNIRYALHNQVRAVWFNPKKPHKLLPELMMLE